MLRSGPLPPPFWYFMRKLSAVAFAAALLGAPLTAGAQLLLPVNLTNTRVTATTGNVAFSAFFVGSGPLTVGPHDGSFDMLSSAIQQVICVDLYHSLRNGQAYFADVTLLASSTSDIASLTRQGQLLGGAAGFSKYLQMAWLAEKFGTQSTSEWAGIQGAIWNLQSTGNPDAASNANVQFWLTQVLQADLSSVDRNSWAVVTNVEVDGGYGGTQEFLVRTNVVPEPATWVLMLTGFAAMVIIARRRRTA